MIALRGASEKLLHKLLHNRLPEPPETHQNDYK